METPLTETCPACDGAGSFWNGRDVETEEPCACCFGLGQVEPGLVWCPCLDADEQGCAHCGGRMLVKASDLPAIERAMEREAERATQDAADRDADEAEYERCARRGLHVSGVRFSGPV